MMDELLPLLPTLVQLGRIGSVSQAAKALGVPRSTISRRLARLETLLGVRLAERNTHRLRLTSAGRRLAEGAASALALLETVREQAVVEQHQVRGLLRVALQPGLAGAFLGWFFAYLHAEHPGIDVELVVTEKPPRRLEEGFDLVLALGTPEPSPWLRRKVTSADVVAVASAAYLEEHGSPRRVAELSRHVLLSSQPSRGAPTWPRRTGARVPIKPRLLTNDLSMLREVALAGIGIALLPQHVVLSDLVEGRLRQVLPQVLGEAVDVYALYPPERRASPVLRAVLSAVTMFAEMQTAMNAGPAGT